MGEDVTLIDCVTSPPTDAMRTAGVTGVSRYLSWADSRDTLRKVIHQAEYDQLGAEGFDRLLNWEYYATDWLRGTASADGTEAVRQAKALGYPAGCAIPGSADFDMTLTQWNNAGSAYAQTYSAIVRDAGYVAGVYGPYDVLTWCRDTGWFGMFWQAGMSTSWSGGRNANLWPGAHLRQRRQAYIGGVDCDVNDILQPDYGQAKGDTVALADEHLMSAPTVTALQALDDLWSMEYLGHSGIGGAKDVHHLNAQINDIQAKVNALATPTVTVNVDPATVKAALLDPDVLAAIAKAVNDDESRRLQE